MSTLTDLKNRISSDLHRSDKTQQIADAIDAAVRHYERDNWWFLEGKATMSTTSSTAIYSAPPDFKGADTMLVTISGSKYPVERVRYSDMDLEDTGLVSGSPSEWAYYQESIRFYPPPDKMYLITLSYRKQLGTLTASSSTAWTNEGFDLIRYRAEWDIYAHDLRNPDMAATCKQSESDAFIGLSKDHTNRVSTGRIKKHGF